MEAKTPADGKVVGYGEIGGRTVVVKANDVSVLAGSGGRIGHRKSDRMMHLALKRGCPIVNLGDAGGARIPDIQGSDGMSSMTITNRPSMRKRRVPMAAAIMGECFGDPSWMAALADFVVQVKGTCMAVSGPRVLEIATNEQVSNEELGGWRLHATVTGQADRVAEDEDDCFRIIRDFLSYLPQNADELAPAGPPDDSCGPRQQKLLEILPEKSNQTYDMQRLIRILVDHEQVFEIKPDFDPSVITCLARMDGRSVGIVANQPLRNAGAMGPDGCDKCVSFIVLCDSFNIPLIFLHDTPGFLVGLAAERKRMPGKIINFIHALSYATVPRVSVVIRKSYGMANCNMGGAGMGMDFVFAWPTADISFMGPEVAANVVYGPKIAAADDPEAVRAKAVQELKLASAPWRAAGLNLLDDVIDPRDTREVVIRSLSLAGGRSGGIGRHLMANWPTSF
jgi:acetyl-CoA carboxylase carboxyltransferase component